MQAGGAFMLGGEQDCYGGCTDATQAFYGLMDEVCATVSDPIFSIRSFTEACIETLSGLVAAVGLSRLALFETKS